MKKYNIERFIILISVIVVAGILLWLFMVFVTIPLIAKHMPQAIPGSPFYFYESDLEILTGRTLQSREDDFFGVPCTRYWYGGTKERDADYLEFFLFDKERQAIKGFEACQEDELYCDGSTEGDESSYCGELRDIMDARVYMYYFRSGNLIVVSDAAVSTYYSEDDMIEVERENKETMRRFDRLRIWIPETFTRDDLPLAGDRPTP